MAFTLEPGFRSPRKGGPAGLALVEVVIAGGILALFIAASVGAMTQINRWASAARLRTLALAVAQQRLDAVLTVPWQVRGTRPALLAAGTATENALPLNDDSFNVAGLGSAFTSLGTPVVATRTTQITDVSARLARADVTVTYSYRNRPYTISLTTLRTTDDF